MRPNERRSTPLNNRATGLELGKTISSTPIYSYTKFQVDPCSRRQEVQKQKVQSEGRSPTTAVHRDRLIRHCHRRGKRDAELRMIDTTLGIRPHYVASPEG